MGKGRRRTEKSGVRSWKQASELRDMLEEWKARRSELEKQEAKRRHNVIAEKQRRFQEIYELNRNLKASQDEYEEILYIQDIGRKIDAK